MTGAPRRVRKYMSYEVKLRYEAGHRPLVCSVCGVCCRLWCHASDLGLKSHPEAFSSIDGVFLGLSGFESILKERTKDIKWQQTLNDVWKRYRAGTSALKYAFVWVCPNRDAFLDSQILSQNCKIAHGRERKPLSYCSCYLELVFGFVMCDVMCVCLLKFGQTPSL